MRSDIIKSTEKKMQQWISKIFEIKKTATIKLKWTKKTLLLEEKKNMKDKIKYFPICCSINYVHSIN